MASYNPKNLRDRRGKKPLAKEKRLAMLNEIYDGTLFWIQEALVKGTGKDTGAATMMLERVRLEIEGLERTRKDQSEKIELTFQCGCCKDAK